MDNRLGQIFRMEKTPLVVVAKCLKDLKLTILYSFWIELFCENAPTARYYCSSWNHLLTHCCHVWSGQIYKKNSAKSQKIRHLQDTCVFRGYKLEISKIWQILYLFSAKGYFCSLFWVIWQNCLPHGNSQPQHSAENATGHS